MGIILIADLVFSNRFFLRLREIFMANLNTLAGYFEVICQLRSIFSVLIAPSVTDNTMHPLAPNYFTSISLALALSTSIPFFNI